MCPWTGDLSSVSLQSFLTLELPIQEGYGESRHFCARGSWCFLIKEELMRNHVGSYRRRGIQGTCFWELFC